MADQKISALTSASTPLAGTEVLPIVQSGSTVKVTVANLTAGRAVSGSSLTASTGGVIIGTAGQGINFAANGGDILTQYDEGTWTPNQGAGLTVVGAFTSSGTYTRVGRSVTVQGAVNGATSIAIAGAPAVICSNLPFVTLVGTAGALFNANLTASGVCAASVSTLYATSAIASSTSITFSVTYQI
jgi:hypothetical protein